MHPSASSRAVRLLSFGTWIQLATSNAWAQPSEAHAQPAAVDTGNEGSPSDEEKARQAFEAGREAYDAGEFQRALDAFQEAYRYADPGARVLLLFNIAQALDRLDRRAEAISYYEHYLTAMPNGPHAGQARGRLRILKARSTISEDAAHPLSEPPPRSEPAEGKGGPPWLVIGIGSAVLLAGGAVLAVLLTGSGSPPGPSVPVDFEREALR